MRRRPKRLRNKRRRRLLREIPQPIEPMVSTTDSTPILADAYPVAIYWDNDLNTFIAELDAFDVQIHAPTRAIATAAAAVTHNLLITNYRLNNYPLPEVG